MATLVINAGQTLNDLAFVGNPTDISAPLQMLGGGEASMSFVFYIDEEGPDDTITGMLQLDGSFTLPTPPISYMPPTGTYSENHVFEITGPGNFSILDPVSGEAIGTVSGAPYSFTLFVTTTYDSETGQTSWSYGTTVPGNPWFGFWTDDDTVTLGAGDDRFLDNTGQLTLDAGDGNDEIFAYGDDPATAGDADSVLGGDGNDEIQFQFGGHTINGGAGNDTIGNSGGTHQGNLETTLIGGEGNDTVYGSATADRFVEADGHGDDTYVGGTGSDTIDYSAISGGGVSVDLGIGFAQQVTGAVGSDIIVEIENVVGTGGADLVLGNAADNHIESGAGDDTIHASAGSDFLDGGEGTDTAVFTGSPADYAVSTNSENQLVVTSGAGTTTLTGFEWVQVGSTTYDFGVLLAGAPVITSGSGGDTANAEVDENSLAVMTVEAIDPNSADTLSFSIIGGDDGAFFEIDAVTGALRFRSLEYYPAPDFEDPRDTDHDNVYHVTVQVSDGNGHFDTQDIAVAVNDLDYVTITGTSLNDVIDATHTVGDQPFPSNEGDYIEGLEGDDTISSLEGNDYIVGGDGADIIDGGSGDDRLGFSEEGGANGVVINLSGSSYDTGNGDPVTIGAYSARDTFGNVDSITDIEGARGTEHDDVFVGTDQISNFEGLGGNDLLIGGSRDDFFNPGAGNDSADGGGPDDADVIHYYEDGSATPQLHGIAVVMNEDNSGTIIDPWGDTDTFVNVETIRGTDFADSFVGSDAHDRFVGAGGADVFDGGGDRDSLDYFWERDPQSQTHGIIVNLSGAAIGPIAIDNLSVADVGAGTIVDTYGDTDTVASIEQITGTLHQDHMVGDDADNGFEGEEGDDVLIGNGGQDEFVGDTGNDTIDGGTGRDSIDYDQETRDFKHLPGSHGVIVNLSNATLEGVSVAGVAATDVAAGTAIDTHGDTDTLLGIEDIKGTDYEDLIVGDDGRNHLRGSGGDDRLYGGGDEDDLQGGEGNDLLFGGVDEDHLQGGAGNDLLVGGGADDLSADFFVGGRGNDTMIGGEHDNEYNRVQYAQEQDNGDDPGSHGVIVNLSGQTLIGVGVDGVDPTNVAAGMAIDSYGDIDTLTNIQNADGTEFDDITVGGDEDNDFDARGGDDIIIGGNGNNQMRGGDGNDTITGGDRDDFVDGGRGDDIAHGGGNGENEYDNIEYREAEDGVHVVKTSRTEGTVDSAWAGHDVFDGFEIVVGSNHADLFDGSDENDDFTGNAGEDVFNGGGGSDRVVYEKEQHAVGGGDTHGVIVNLSDDTISADIGQGMVAVAAGTAIDGFGDTDTLNSIEQIDGTEFDDHIVGSQNGEFNELQGRDGNDTLIGGSGRNNLSGGDGNDTLVGGDEEDNLDAGRGNDVVTAGGGNFDYINGSSGADSIDGGDGYDLIGFKGFNGADHVHVVLGTSAPGGGSIVGSFDGEAVATSFTASEQVTGTAGEDTFVVQVGFEATEHSRNTFWDGRGSNGRAFDFVGGNGNDTFTDNSEVDGGAALVDYDEERFSAADYHDWQWGTHPGEHGVIVNLSTAEQTVTGFDFNDGGAPADVTVEAGTALDTFGSTDTLNGIQSVILTDAADHFFGSNSGNFVEGRNGDDILVGGTGNDILNGNEGNDTISGGAGDDNLSGWFGDDTISGGAGGDYINTGFGNDDADGGSGGSGNTWDTLGFSWGQPINPGDGLDVVFSGLDGAGTAAGSFADGTDDDGNPRYGSLNLTFTGFEHVEGTNGDDSFTVQAGFVGSADSPRPWPGDRGMGLVDVSGGAGNDSFVDLADPTGAAGGSMIVSYDGDKWGTDNFDGHLWGSGAGEHGVVVNLSSSLQTATDFNLNDGGSTVSIDVAAHQSFGISGDTDSFAGVQAVWLTDADDWFWGDDTLDSFVGGAAGDDHLFGGAGDDVFFGGIGADTIVGGIGHDTVRYDWHDAAPTGILVNLTSGEFTYPGIYVVAAGHIRDLDGSMDSVSGIEEVIGSNLNDYMVAGNQGVTLRGGAGNDTLSSGSGVDSLYGGDGDDWLGAGSHFIGDGDNYLDGGEGSDTLGGAGGADEMYGGGGQDQMVGRQGNDLMHGGTHQDNLYGSVGNDELHGDDGDDLLVGGSGDDLIDGGTGDAFGGVDGIDDDLVDYSLEASNEDAGGPLATGEGVIVNMSGAAVTVGSHTVAAGHARDVFGGNDTLIEIENVRGTSLADVLIGDGENNELYGLGGNDTLTGGAGVDTLDGGGGSDTIDFSNEGGSFRAVVDLSQSAIRDTFNNLEVVTGIESATGTALNDTFTGDSGDNTFTGLDGGDQFQGLTGNDTMYGGNGDDSFHSGADTGDGNDAYDGGDGIDTYYVGGLIDTHIDLEAGTATSAAIGSDTLISIENIVTNAGNDTLLGNGEANILGAGFGTDTLDGRGGNDTLDGYLGDDSLTGGAGDDEIDGGDGEDTAYYSGDRADYDVAANLDGSFTITDLRGGVNDGVDQVTNVESFSFSDGTFTADQLLGAPVTAPEDADAADDQVDENAGVGSTVGITAAATDPNSGDTITYSLSSNPGGLFAIDAETGVVTTAANMDFETMGSSIEIEVTATSSDGSSEATTFEVAIGDVDEAPVSSDATVTVVEDGTYTFGADDFPFADPDQGGGSALVSITIYSPPGAGTLSFDGATLDAGTIGAGFAVSAADLAAGKLTYTSAADANGDDYASFSYAVSSSSQVGLAGAWSFEGSGDDISAGDNDVALFGGATYGEGLRGGQALQLDGFVGSYAEQVANDGAFDFGAGDFSVVAWFRLDGTPTREQTIVEDFFGSGGPGWTLTLPGSGEVQFYTSGAGTVNAVATVGDGEWHQVVVTRSDDEFSLYLDGALINTHTTDLPINDSDGPLLIGARDAADTRNFTVDGSIDDVAIWSRPLSAAEVAAQWNDGDGVDIAGTGTPMLSAPATMTIDVTPVNDAPVISSNGGGENASVNRAENGVAVTTVIAADIDGPDVTYAIVGGADAARFTIDPSTGVLSFVAAPDFELPDDLDGNNVYEVVVAASDGSLTDTQTIAVTVTDLGGVTINGTGSADTIDATHTPAGQPLPTNEADIIYGNGGNDVISGLGGDDFIDGGAGGDTMRGGNGNDTYIVGASSDQVIENAGEGTDEVRSSVTHTLASEVENLTLTGASSINGTGNALDNVLTGNSAANTLNGGLGADQLVGGLGNDVYVVDNAGDTVVELIGEGTDLVQASISYELGDEVENLTLTGNGNIDGIGNGFGNTVVGNTGNNTLNGGGGFDTLIGGAGSDTYIIDEATDVVTEGANAGTDTVLFEGSGDYALGGNVENLVLGADAANGTGNGLANTITGNSGANVLSGGTGADTLIGGGGDDTYVVDNIGDLAIEQPGGGTDQVNASVSFTLGAEVENLTLTGTASITGSGNAMNNVITGNAAANTLNGGAGADLMVGGAGNDTYVVDDAGDVIDETVNGGAGTDTVQSAISFDLGGAAVLGDVERLTLIGTGDIDGTGNALNNVITGNSGDNILDGGTGADNLAGGLGNDTFVTDGGDTITEATAAGIDTVMSSVDYTLGVNLENLVLVGAALNGTGNGLDNTITGNANANVLNGGVGIDTLIGGAGDDVYIVDNVADIAAELDGEGVDEVRSTVSYSLGSGVENLTLSGGSAINGTGNGLANLIVGNGASNTLSGGGGDDMINGGAGADIMSGGEGNDSFVVDNLGDVVTELAGEGIDLVLASVSHTLGAEVENLTLTGTGAISGTGNSLNNVLIGGVGANVLNGLEGADQMIGGAGNDTYVVDNADDFVDEASDQGAGIDTVLSSISFNLADSAHVLGEVERLTLTGTANLNGTGNSADNLITGNAGSNVLDGGAGTDTMAGGMGNDTYIADIVGDVVSESASGGTDTVFFNGAAGNYVLGANVENLTLGGSAAISGTGNGLANAMLGNGAGNTLSGGLGNDTLNGGGGADTLIGGGGNDTYVVDNAGDIVDEGTGGSGTDTVQSAVNFSLIADGAHVLGVVENLILTGTASASGTGNALDNFISGNAGNNILFGAAGDDTLSGNNGSDTLIGGTGHDDLFGGAGADVFDFNVADFGGAGGSMADHSDEIFDFSVADGDSIDLSGLLNDAMALVGGEVNSLLRASMVGDDFVVEVNESAVLDGSAVQSNWGQAVTLRDIADPEGLTVVFSNQTWHYDADTHLFGL